MKPQTLYNIFASHQEGQWIMRPPNATYLYKFVKENDVSRILDLGTGIGCATAMMALALRDAKRDGKIYSVEQFDKCIEIAKELIPEDLQKNVVFQQSDPVPWQTDSIPYQYFSIFEELPEDDFDLIVVDGPGPFFDGKENFIDLPNGDVLKLNMEDKLKPGVLIAWDGRIQALRKLERYYGSNFYLADQIERSNMNVLERKDNAVKLSDVDKERMQDRGYVPNKATKGG